MVRRYSWWLTLVLFLGPGAATTAYTLGMAHLFTSHSLPAGLGLSTSPVVLLEIGYLVALGRRRNGRLSLDGVVGYRDRLPPRRLAAVVAGLFGAAAVVYLLFTPLIGYLHHGVARWLPPALTGDGPGSTSTGARLVVLTANIAINGVLEPVVEEAYFRGHLLPRMPWPGVAGGVANAALFSVQHFWQPDLYLLVFVLQLLSIGVLRRVRDLRVPILLHSFVNLAGTLISLT